MFRIRKITLYKGTEYKDYWFTDNAYVFGPNSVGKTALTKVIDYVLGSSDPLSHDGLDNIEHVGAYIVNDKTELWIKRSVTGEYFYKRTEFSNYTLVSAPIYKDTICEMITGTINTKALKVYQNVFEENPTYRAFSFINFIDEVGQGDLRAVFTRGKDVKHFVRIRKIMDFFFNYENIEKKYEKRLELEKLEEEQKSLNSIIGQYEHSRNQIKELFMHLGLDYSDEMSANYNIFREFQYDFSRKKTKAKDDIVYLAKASYALSEEIKMYSYLQEQGKKTDDRKARTQTLLSILNSIVAENDKYAEEVDVIKKTIQEIQQDRLILSLADYDAAIEKIEKEKGIIDRKLEVLKSKSSNLDYDQTVRMLTLLEDDFNTINSNANITRIYNLQEEIQKIKKQINELDHNAYSQKALDEFNAQLNNMYLYSTVQNVKYLNEDRRKEGFYLTFNPFSQTLIAKAKINGGKSILPYNPGSMARHNHLQLLVYLCMFDYLHRHFHDFIYLPILIIDSVDQSIDGNAFDELYPSIVKNAKTIGIQTIFISKYKPSTIHEEDLIDISDGLNPFHSKGN